MRSIEPETFGVLISTRGVSASTSSRGFAVSAAATVPGAVPGAGVPGWLCCSDCCGSGCGGFGFDGSSSCQPNRIAKEITSARMTLRF